MLANAGVDEDCAAVEFQSEALDRAAQAIAVQIEEVGRDRIAASLDRRKIESRQKSAQWQRKIIVVDNDRDLNIADHKTHHARSYLADRSDCIRREGAAGVPKRRRARPS